MATIEGSRAAFTDLKIAILEFLLENGDTDKYANTGQRVFERLHDRYGDVIKRSTVYHNLKIMAENKILEKKENDVRGENNQPQLVIQYYIPDKFKPGVVARIREKRGT